MPETTSALSYSSTSFFTSSCMGACCEDCSTGRDFSWAGMFSVYNYCFLIAYSDANANIGSSFLSAFGFFAASSRLKMWSLAIRDIGPQEGHRKSTDFLACYFLSSLDPEIAPTERLSSSTGMKDTRP